jgi:hypothetical protein
MCDNSDNANFQHSLNNLYRANIVEIDRLKSFQPIRSIITDVVDDEFHLNVRI